MLSCVTSMPVEPFQVIVADPAWAFRDSMKNSFNEKNPVARSAVSQYSTMSQVQIARLLKDHEPKIDIAKDAILFLWRVAAMQREALDVCHAWGFTPKTEMVWVKQSRGILKYPNTPIQDSLHFGMGHYTRASHETCIIASRGKGASLIKSRSIRSVFFAPVGRHSEKPEKFYDIVERLAPGPYVEFFARRHRPGWTCYGDEVNGDKLRATT